ncbi:hypothetical protein DAKH74_047170 [Maudiozyma humilis]|uniref:Uncharacterized protein n=1 Tax=Maudiozyma humilis TaxID=51915 RepID=A0AAV5S3T3_MAUHU|nr:hypothetical protein DAKH74_047170 [Kazachstania humilis]
MPGHEPINNDFQVSSILFASSSIQRSVRGHCIEAPDNNTDTISACPLRLTKLGTVELHVALTLTLLGILQDYHTLSDQTTAFGSSCSVAAELLTPGDNPQRIRGSHPLS